MIEITLPLVLVLLLAAGIAMLVRLYDYPATPLTWQSVALSFLASLVAAFLTAWMGSDAGMDVFTFAGFVVVAGAAVGGISAVRAIITGAAALNRV